MSSEHPHQDPELAQKIRDPQWGAGQLATIAVFKGFLREELAMIYSKGSIQSVKPKAYVVIEGEPTRGLYIILQGTVSVYKNDPITGSMARLAYLEEGNSFGELSLFDTAPRSASVSAESVAHLFCLDAEVFNQILASDTGDMQARFYKACAEELVGRFRRLNSDYITAQQLLWKHALHRNADGGEKSTKDTPEAAVTA